MEAENHYYHQNKLLTNSEEINLFQIVKSLYEGRWLILKIVMVFFLFGLIIAFTSQPQFRAEARILPEIKDGQGSTSTFLRQLGGLGGFSLPAGEAADAIRPELYPDILRSTPFFLELMELSIKTKTKNGIEDVNLSVYLNDYLKGDIFGVINTYTIGLPSRILSWLQSGKKTRTDLSENISVEIPKISQEQHENYKTLRQRLNASIDQRSGIITISAEFPDPLVSAQITDYAVKYLANYIVEYRIEKAHRDLQFVKDRYDEKKEEFLKSQFTLAHFRDANMNMVTASARSEEQRLQDHYNLTFNVYNSLAQQLEQARIKVQETTPVIKILEPVQVPFERIKPKRSLIILISVFLGSFAGIIAFLGKRGWERN
jgi:LPS O-antigen subunit length determinant protein (WzzB/FepE family)